MTDYPQVTDKLNAGLRNLYTCYAHLDDAQIRIHMRTYLRHVVKQIQDDAVQQRTLIASLAHSFGILNKRTTAANISNGPYAKPCPSAKCSAALHCLLYPHETGFPPEEQSRLAQERLENARLIAQDWGLNLVDLLTHLDLLLSARNQAFDTALNHSFMKIIYHLNPRQAEKLGVPKPVDLRIDTRRDPERVERLVDYIRCGRLARDTAYHYRHELQNTVFSSPQWKTD